MSELKLIFVYNANSGLFSSVTDFAHKILSPSTYQCHLCALTYGNISMKNGWKSFIENLQVQTVFLHKDQFETQYKTYTSLPAIFIIVKDTVKEMITKQEIEVCHTLDELKRLVIEKLKEHVQHHNTNI